MSGYSLSRVKINAPGGRRDWTITVEKIGNESIIRTRESIANSTAQRNNGIFIDISVYNWLSGIKKKKNPK